MRIKKINDFFSRFGTWQIRNRLPILFVILVVTIAGFLGLSRLVVTSDIDEWFEDSEEIKRNSDLYEEKFGNEDMVMILVEADDVFDPEVLAMIRDLGTELLEKVPYARDIYSLTDMSIAFGDEEGIEIVNPFEDGIPDDPAELAAKKEYIMSRESLVNMLVSDDCGETWLILRLNNYETANEYAEMLLVGKAAKEVLSGEKWQSPAYTLKPTGMAYTETEEAEVVEKEASIRVITGFIVVFICLVVFTRSLRGVIVPVLATLGGIGTVLGFEGHLGIHADSNLITLPVLLSMALAIGYAIHLINMFKIRFRESGSREKAVVEAVGETGWPILFTAVTTIASLLSFLAAGIVSLRWLGATSALTVLAVYLYVVFLIPPLFSFGKDRTKQPAEPGQAEKKAAGKPAAAETPKRAGTGGTDAWFRRFGEKLLKTGTPLLVISFIVIAAFIPGLFRMSVNMEYFSIMGKKIPYIQRLDQIRQTKLGSLYSYTVMIRYDELDAFLEGGRMKNLDALAEKLSGLSMTKVSGTKGRVSSVTKVVKEMNRVFNGDDPAWYRIPDTREELAELILFCDSDSVHENLDEDFSTAVLQVEIMNWDGNKITDDMAKAKVFAGELFPDADCSIIGMVANFAAMNGKIVYGELKSFSGSFVIILILLSLVFAGLSTGLIGMIPNIAPVVILGGIMGYTGTPLDMLTMTIMPMVLGIAVDDTIHFISRIKIELERTGSYRDAVLDSFRALGKTLGMTTVILCAMFVVYVMSPVAMLSRMGLYSIIGLGSALLADYILTPLLIFALKPLGKETRENGENGAASGSA
ncbi:MAG: MMPL family transporter [Treponema sp.]|jgi:predicted RND superfamily exporter protein|nr:MMPL family transporter [Treponema sp.]